MKKLLCIFMAVLMVFSSAFVFGASAAEGYAARNTLEKFDSYSDFVAKNGDKEIFGFTYDTLYESNSFVDWTKLDISYSSENGPVYYDKGAFSLAFGDISAYLKRVTAFFFSGDRLFSEENALNITNFIGKMINPDFKEVTYMFGTSVTPNEEDFFLQIAKQSGLGDIMQNNWCGKGPDFFKPFLSAFGGDGDLYILFCGDLLGFGDAVGDD
ncbi:MAG: hypothetical protein IKV21_02900, partial [Clostridia bacterium]|nr:hypothetical protein [Clostridia bacterium]